MIRERGWGFSKLNQLDIHTRVPPHGYMFVSRVGAHRFPSRGRLLTDCLKSLFFKNPEQQKTFHKQSDEEFEYTNEEEECLQISQNREKRGLREELLTKKEGVEHVSNSVLGRTGG